jgi:SAM-dependent methyltransferase
MANDTMREKIFGDYIGTTGVASGRADHSIPHDRNLEGFEMTFLRFIPKEKSARILDIGCGCGQLLYMLREKGYKNIKGVDIGDAQVALTRKLGIDAEKIDDLEKDLQRTGEWDVIILSQVVEHFTKEKIFVYLTAVKNALAVGGTVIISTPNMALASGLFQRYIDFTHETGFTERSLHEVLRVSGFDGIAIYPDTLTVRWRPKFLIWWLLRNIWFAVLGFIYLLERGSERPKVISRHLIAVAKSARN